MISPLGYFYQMLANVITELWPVILFIIAAITTVLIDFFLKKYFRELNAKKTHKIIPSLNQEVILHYTKYYIEPILLEDSPGDYSKTSPIPLKQFRRLLYKPSDRNKFFFVLAESGMGKTSLLINLLFKHYSIWNFKTNTDIKYFKINKKFELNIDKLIASANEANTILFLDALDEATDTDDFKQKLDSIIEKCEYFKRIIITSRLQLFNSISDIPKLTNALNTEGNYGPYQYRTYYIPPFTNSNVRKYLRKRFALLNPLVISKRALAYKVVTLSPHLMLRPMILSHIGELIEGEAYGIKDFVREKYAAIVNKFKTKKISVPVIRKKHADEEPTLLFEIIAQKISTRFKIYFHSKRKSNQNISTLLNSNNSVKSYQFSFQIYSKIINQWITREATKKIINGPIENFKNELYQFSVACAIYKYSNNQEGKFNFKREDFETILSINNLSFEHFTSAEFTTRSLLTRNDEGQWDFAHQSIFEYFLAERVVKTGLPHNFLLNLKALDMCEHFINEMSYYNYTLHLFNEILLGNTHFAVKFKENKLDVLLDKISYGQLQVITGIEFDNSYDEHILSVAPECFFDFRAFVPLVNLNYQSLLHLGKLYWARHNPDAAYFFRRAIAINPEKAEPYYHFGLLLKYGNHYQNAIAEIKKAVVIDPQQEYAIELANLLLITGDNEEAFQYLEDAYISGKYLRNDKNVTDYYELGSFMNQIHQYEKAIKYLTHDSINVTFFILYNALGVAYRGLGNYTVAIDWFTKAFQSSKKAVVSLADTYLDQIVYCQRDMGLKPEDILTSLKPKYLELYKKDRFQYYVSMVDLYLALSNKNISSKYLLKASHVHNNDPENLCLLGHKYRLYFDDLTLATQFYENVLLTNPNHKASLYGLAKIKYDEENYDEAIRLFKLGIVGRHSEVTVRLSYLYLGKSYFFNDDLSNAIKFLTKAADMDKSNDEAYYWLSIALDTTHGRTYYLSKALFNNPRGFHNNELMGIALKNIGVDRKSVDILQMSRRYLETAAKIDPNQTDTTDTLSEVLAYINDFSAGEE